VNIVRNAGVIVILIGCYFEIKSKKDLKPMIEDLTKIEIIR